MSDEQKRWCGRCGVNFKYHTWACIAAQIEENARAAAVVRVGEEPK